jgi:glycosyltransferase involved in cell wall biosynthesis
MGDGPLKEEVLAYIQQHNLTQVKITGFISDEERNHRISHAMWMVTPPHTNEDLGLTVIESRSVKVPCIISRDGGLPEAGGKKALSCRPGDIEGLKNLLEKTARMPKNEYIQLAEATNLELKQYLKPLSLYSRAYRNTLRAHQKLLPSD